MHWRRVKFRDDAQSLQMNTRCIYQRGEAASSDLRIDRSGDPGRAAVTRMSIVPLSSTGDERRFGLAWRTSVYAGGSRSSSYRGLRRQMCSIAILRRPGQFVARDSLSVFHHFAVRKVRREPCRTNGVASNYRRESRLACPALYHRENVESDL